MVLIDVFANIQDLALVNTAGLIAEGEVNHKGNEEIISMMRADA
jgi:hypothetical protein